MLIELNMLNYYGFEPGKEGSGESCEQRRNIMTAARSASTCVRVAPLSPPNYFIFFPSTLLTINKYSITQLYLCSIIFFKTCLVEGKNNRNYLLRITARLEPDKAELGSPPTYTKLALSECKRV